MSPPSKAGSACPRDLVLSLILSGDVSGLRVPVFTRNHLDNHSIDCPTTTPPLIVACLVCLYVSEMTPSDLTRLPAYLVPRCALQSSDAYVRLSAACSPRKDNSIGGNHPGVTVARCAELCAKTAGCGGFDAGVSANASHPSLERELDVTFDRGDVPSSQSYA